MQRSILSRSRRPICHTILLCWLIPILLLTLWSIVMLIGTVLMSGLIGVLIIIIPLVIILLIMPASLSIAAASSFHIVIILITFRVVVVGVLHLVRRRMTVLEVFPVISIEQACRFNFGFSPLLEDGFNFVIKYADEVILDLFFLQSRKSLFIF